MKNKYLFLCLLLFIVLPLHGQESIQYSCLSRTLQAWGEANDISVVGNYAYIADGESGFRIVDITNPDSIVTVNTTDTGGKTVAVYVTDTHAYVTDMNTGLHIFNIENPTKPTEQSTFSEFNLIPKFPGKGEWFAVFALDIVVSDNIAYLAAGCGGLQIIDVKDSSHPILISDFQEPVSVFKVVIKDNFAYLASDNGFYIVNISNPKKPKRVCFYNTHYAVNNLSLLGNIAYITENGKVLRAIDITNKAKPKNLGSLILKRTDPNDLVINGDFAYLTYPIVNYESGLAIVNITNPARPVEVAFSSIVSNANSVGIIGKNAYVACQKTGLQILDISNPLQIINKGYNQLAAIKDFDVTNQYALIANFDKGIYIYDVSDSLNPLLVSKCVTPGKVLQVVAKGYYAYVTDDQSNLYIVDFSNPLKPFIASTNRISGNICSIFVSGQYIYVISSTKGLAIIDVSDPNCPKEVGSLNTTQLSQAVETEDGHYVFVSASTSTTVEGKSVEILPDDYDNSAHCVVAEGNFVYVATEKKLCVLDMSNPKCPKLVRLMNRLGSIEKILTQGNMLYLLSRDNRFQILNITDPVHPKVISSITLLNKEYTTFSINRTTAYVGTENGCYMIDISNDYDPKLTGFLETKGSILKVIEQNSLIFIATNDSFSINKKE